MTTMTMDETLQYLRSEPEYAALVRDAYLGEDVFESARRFQASTEFQSVLRFLGNRVAGGTVIDLGAGTGIASWAFLHSGARRLYAIEPDGSDLVGRGAIARLCSRLNVEIIAAFGESLPLPHGIADVFYVRQVLHHTQDLPQVMREAARLLKPGGILIATREHVADNEEQLQAFLAHHPTHRFTGSEHAYKLEEYTGAIVQAGLSLTQTLGPWDTVINAFPAVHTEEELRDYPRLLLQRRLGGLGAAATALPGVSALVWKKIKAPTPGRLYTFVANRSSS